MQRTEIVPFPSAIQVAPYEAALDEAANVTKCAQQKAVQIAKAMDQHLADVANLETRNVICEIGMIGLVMLQHTQMEVCSALIEQVARRDGGSS